ncbi:MAG: serine protein kinase PrkA [Gemmatimonadetes bacterium]|nr:MAG: serine protein kinase PrkA [Gemmatimonadota bacterium]
MSDHINNAIQYLDQSVNERGQRFPISFQDFLKILLEKPQATIRNVFQVFHDMIKTYLSEGVDEYPNDPESIHFVFYDCNRLFVEGSDNPFFADRLFANRLVNHVDALKRGAQQNKLYIFEGPYGCGKSTFLNNLLRKFEEYTRTDAGIRYETVWRIDRQMVNRFTEADRKPLAQQLTDFSADPMSSNDIMPPMAGSFMSEYYIEIPCPSHDHPLLMIPKELRRGFFDHLLENNEFKFHLFTDKEYNWVFRDNACTICTSLYHSLLNKLKSPQKVFEAIYVRPYMHNRRLGEGISVFNPGDKPSKEHIHTNPMLQNQINTLFRDSNQVKYIYSRYAKTNNGIYALMDVKSHNVDRLLELHNIISEGVHKVGEIEENVTSLFIALMNPEDKKTIEDFQSFSDRIEYININYVLDLNTEVEIYRNIFGKYIDRNFLPRVLHNFARVIIATRLNKHSDALIEWIGDPKKYRLYCDENLLLLKMEIFTGHIPGWLTEEDRNRFTAKRRRSVITESETEGKSGLSGRDSIKIFNQFYSTYAREDRLINMSALYDFFTKTRKDLSALIPEGFLDSLVRMYDYAVLQEVKESLYYYNEDRIAKDIQNYIFATNFEIGATETCIYTGEKLEITESFLESIENRLLGANVSRETRQSFRQTTQKEYTTQTLTQEIMTEGKSINETALFQSLYDRYVYNLKEKALDPFLDNENFRQAIKDYNTDAFKAHDKRIRDDVSYLIENFCTKYAYTEQGAKEVCIYVIDNELATKFAKT